MKYEMFANPAFVQLMSRVFNQRLPATTGYRVLKLQKELQEEEKIFLEIKNKIVQKYSSKDEAGDTKYNPATGQIIWEEDTTKELEKEYKELTNIEFLPKNTLDLDMLSSLDLSSVELGLLEYSGVLVFPESQVD